MKVFISCDIEGVATTTYSQECAVNRDSEHFNPAPHAAQMTREAAAACEGAIAAGATEIVVRDAHGTGANIDATGLPECAQLIRGWSGHPYAMVEGLDGSFDAMMFVGYHAAAGRPGNPRAHTSTGGQFRIKLNGIPCSEFVLYSFAGLHEGVPSVLLTGDQMLCDDSAPLHPALVTVPVKEGVGNMTKAISPALAVKRIRDGAEKALRQDLKSALGTLPDSFVLEITYKEHARAKAMSYFPGMVQTGINTIRLETKNIVDVLRTTRFVL